MKTLVKLGLGVIALVFLCTYIGAVSGAVTSGPPPAVNGASSISYADFIAIMLTAVSLMVTILAFILAALAYIGWNSLSAKVAEEVRNNFSEGFKPGGKLHKLFAEEKNKLPYEGTQQISDDFENDAGAEGDKDY